MKNKASLVLMEQLVMILVFSVAAAVSLGIFAKAHQISQQSENLDTAVFLAQNAAETVKTTRGDLASCCRILNGTLQDDTLCVTYGRHLQADADGEYSLFLQKLPKDDPFLGRADIWVVLAEKPEETIFSLNVSWQEAP